MNTPKVSIIIPVFNVEHYLQRCIDSVRAQSLIDIEIILVDDGSTDGSGKICDKNAEIDNRIRVMHKQNEGLSSARNDGIEASAAPYIMFVDSDDWVESDFCKKPYNIVEKQKVDLVLFSFNRVFNDDRIEPAETIYRGSRMLSEEEAIRFNTYVAKSAWLGLYSKSLFNKVKFPVGKFYEEYSTSHRLIHSAEAIWFVDDSLYNYRVGRPGSITTDPVTRMHPDLREMTISRIKDLYSWGYEKYIQRDAFLMLIKYGCQRPDHAQLLDIVRNIRDATCGAFNWKQRVMLRVFFISPKLFDIICMVLKRRIE